MQACKQVAASFAAEATALCAHRAWRTCACLASAQEENPLLRQVMLLVLEGGQQRGQRDAGGALDVVVEGADLAAVRLQDPGRQDSPCEA